MQLITIFPVELSYHVNVFTAGADRYINEGTYFYRAEDNSIKPTDPNITSLVHWAGHARELALIVGSRGTYVRSTDISYLAFMIISSRVRNSLNQNILYSS